jgi:NAD(P)-dependent dehydrogenase (short-subunit alcohol dehydrogenase family)
VRWTASDIPDLTGRTAVVTGANGGLGLETAKVLAGAGAHVVMAARDQEKAAAARDEILVAHPEASLEIVELDLGSLDSVKGAAATINAAHPTIDILVNNAGVMAMPEGRTANGFETQFGINHLGHWALTGLLLHSILAADAARVVTVTSTGHHFGRAVDRDNPHLEGNYGPWRAYNQSKLANFHFAIGLQREFGRRGLAAQSLVAHPGLTNSDLQTRAVEAGSAGAVGRLFHSWVGSAGMTTAQGALPQLRAATDPRAKGGQMYAPRYINAGAAVRRPILRRVGLSKAIDNLWTVSERETGIALDVDAASSGAR